MLERLKCKKCLFFYGLFALLVVPGWLMVGSADGDQNSGCFYASLHHTGEGMRYWYEENGGFKDITGIPYQQLDCQNCHVKSCEQCHAEKDESSCAYTLEKARNVETCLSCHSREKVTFSLCEKNKTLDVHMAGGMGCTECHKGADVHGDGQVYRTMRDEGAVKVACTDCHQPEQEIKAHTVHKGKLDCAACHISNTTSCLNCHFDRFIEEGTRKGNFFPPCQDWVILVIYKGKVTSGNVQTLVYKGKKFITYAPYFTHAVQAEARECRDCHNNEAVRLMKAGQSVPMAVFKNNAMVSWKGVVPLLPDQLKWDFAEKKGQQWMLLKDQNKPTVQFSCYAEPLDKDQLEKLATVRK